jgi:hypothetical protein
MGTAQCTAPTAVRQLSSGVPALGNILVKFCCDVTYALSEIGSARYQRSRGQVLCLRDCTQCAGRGSFFDNQAVRLHLPSTPISRLRSIRPPGGQELRTMIIMLIMIITFLIIMIIMIITFIAAISIFSSICYL